MKTNLPTRKTNFQVRLAKNELGSSFYGGFALLEIILAMALFSIVAVGMTRALDQIAQNDQKLPPGSPGATGAGISARSPKSLTSQS